MNEQPEHIVAFDCLPFERFTATGDVLQAFMQSQRENVFWFTPGYNAEDESKLAEYDYRINCWTAGRFVGEAIFEHNGIAYKITIKPRFGEKMLLRMLEEIFNIRITSSASEASKKIEWQHYIKRIIAFIWLQKLANANLHGVPKTQTKKDYKGEIIRGKLDVRQSIKSLYRSNEVVSTFREKQVDSTIAQIIFQAYNILKSDFAIGNINIPDSAREALNQIHTTVKNRDYVTESDYKHIRYKDIYLSWKPVVDLSWDIIKRKKLSLKQTKASKGYGFFIDMAEVWEQYLRSLLRKNLTPIGWKYKDEKQVAYKGFFWERELIPDFVFQKGNDVAVWDAKYKRMMGRNFDVDRSDFFQIHTYIQFHFQHKTVKAGGLLYPISASSHFDQQYICPFLIHENGQEINFSIDGVQLMEMSETDDHKQLESDFIRRIISTLKTNLD